MPTTLDHPYAPPNAAIDEWAWLKGNLHTHTTRSDGSQSPQEVIDAYAAMGHDFLALTDHDVFADYTGLDSRGMVLIPAVEVTAFGPHVLQIGGNRQVEPDADRQKVIDAINAAGGVAVVNHPNWEADWDHCPFDLMCRLQNYAGLEVFNGVCVDLEGSGYAADKWERLLSTGRVAWGFANDDLHKPHHIGRGCNVVLVRREQANAAGIVAALRRGSFYASTGVQVEGIDVQGTELHILAMGAKEIEIYGDRGRRLAHAFGPEIIFDFADVESSYLRPQLYGTGTQMAWLQPMAIRGGPAERRRGLEAGLANGSAPRPVLTARRASALPPPDSSDAEALWRTAAPSELPYDMRTADRPAVATTLRALVSERELALRIDCQEPLMSQMKVRIAESGVSTIWTDESLEIFLDPEGQQKRYYHMMINPAGAFCVVDPAGWSKSLAHRSSVRREAQGWSVELRFDLGTLLPGKAFAAGARLGLHVCRNRQTVGRHYVWAWVGSSNHSPEKFGSLQL